MTTRRPTASVLVCSLTLAFAGCTSLKTIPPSTRLGLATFGPWRWATTWSSRPAITNASGSKCGN